VRRLIAVTGYKNSGKNAICSVLEHECDYVVTGFADKLKAMLLAMNPIIHCDPISGPTPTRLKTVIDAFGWDIAKEDYPEVRRLLQTLGTEAGRNHLGEQVWVDAWRRDAGTLLGQGRDVCVSDMRFLNEAQAVRSLGGQIWRVLRPGTARGEHLSESELDQIVPDRVIQNGSSLEDLTRRVMREMS
jgi:hypothetical protein